MVLNIGHDIHMNICSVAGFADLIRFMIYSEIFKLGCQLNFFHKQGIFFSLSRLSLGYDGHL